MGSAVDRLPSETFDSPAAFREAIGGARTGVTDDSHETSQPTNGKMRPQQTTPGRSRHLTTNVFWGNWCRVSPELLW